MFVLKTCISRQENFNINNDTILSHHIITFNLTVCQVQLLQTVLLFHGVFEMPLNILTPLIHYKVFLGSDGFLCLYSVCIFLIHTTFCLVFLCIWLFLCLNFLLLCTYFFYFFFHMFSFSHFVVSEFCAETLHVSQLHICCFIQLCVYTYERSDHYFEYCLGFQPNKHTIQHSCAFNVNIIVLRHIVLPDQVLIQRNRKTSAIVIIIN